MEAFKSKVAGKDDKDFLEGEEPEEGSGKKSETRSQEPQEPYEMQRHINNVLRSGVMGMFLGDSSISFQVGKKGSGFYFSSEGVINLDPQWFLERGLDAEMVEWAMYHEARHAIDRRDNLEAFDGRLDKCIKWATEWLPFITEKWRKSINFNDEKQKAFFESLVDEVPMLDGTGKSRTVPRAVYPLAKTYFSILYNSLDDIWVNHGIYSMIPKFEPHKEGGNKVANTYRTVLFPDGDYKQLPLSFQYAYALLRKAMLPQESIALDQEVESCLARDYKEFGRKYNNRQDLVSRRIMPGHAVDTSVGSRDRVIESVFLPDFNELIKKDLDYWVPRWKEPKSGGQPGEGEEGESSGQDVSPFDAPMREHETNTIDQLDDKASGEIDKFFGNEKERKEAAKRFSKLTPEEQAEIREKEAKLKRYNSALDREGVAPEDRQKRLQELISNTRKYEKYKSRVSRFVDELAGVWHEIIGRGKEFRWRNRQYQKKGTLDIQETINHYPEIRAGHFDPENPLLIYKGRKIEVREHIIPEEIRVFFLADLSGSVKSDQSKMEALKEVTVLLTESFRELQNLIYANRPEGVREEDLCKVRVRIIGYNNSSFDLKSSKEDLPFEEVEAVVSNIDEAKSGDTYSDTAFSEVVAEVEGYDETKVDDGRIKILVIELTDGATGTEVESKALVDRLKIVHKALVAGLLIGDQVSPEDQSFETLQFVHGDSGEKVSTENVAKVIERIIKNSFADSML